VFHLIHADTGVGDFDGNQVRRWISGSFHADGCGARVTRVRKVKVPPKGIEDKIDERFTNFAYRSHDGRRIRRQFAAHFDADALPHRHIAPACAGHIRDLLNQVSLICGGARVN
jgi:hypothetical protein